MYLVPSGEPSPDLSPTVPSRRRSSAKRKGIFLAALAETGLVSHAAKAAGVNRHRVWQWEQTDPTFRELRRDAEQAFDEAIVAEMRRRAMEGYDEVTTEQGPDGKPLKVRTVRKCSEGLLLALARARMPEMFDRQRSTPANISQTNNVTMPVVDLSRLSDEDFAALGRMMGAAGPLLVEGEKVETGE